MRNSIFALFLSLIALNFACSQNPPKSPHLTVEGKDVKVVYGQPSKRGRVIFGADGSQSLEKYGKVWRTGADEATVITFKKDGMFGGKAVKAGDYGFFTIPGEKEWVVILNSEPKQWGAYNYKQDKDVLRITVPAMTLKEPVEKLTYEVKDNALVFMWDTAGFSVPLQF
ncbi:DUF2911 domain-containing protein [Runella sp.]|uniref:DUF2911 domain-containing protein n=1 Tax=Runella sp. TaxID=1960881 RepID=UPI003D0FE674